MKITNSHSGTFTGSSVPRQQIVREVLSSTKNLLSSAITGEASIYTGTVTGVVGACVGLIGSATNASKSLIGALSALLVSIGMGCIINGTYFGKKEGENPSMSKGLPINGLGSNKEEDLPQSHRRKSA